MIQTPFYFNLYLRIFADMVAEILRTQDWAIIYLITAIAVICSVRTYYRIWRWSYQYKYQKMLTMLMKISGIVAIIHGILLILAIVLRLTA